MAKMVAVSEVYTPDKMMQIHLSRGWADYIWSSAHARRMQAAQFQVDDAAYASHVKALERTSMRLTPKQRPAHPQVNPDLSREPMAPRHKD